MLNLICTQLIQVDKINEVLYLLMNKKFKMIFKITETLPELPCQGSKWNHKTSIEKHTSTLLLLVFCWLVGWLVGWWVGWLVSLFSLVAPECLNREGFQEALWLEEKDRGLALQLSEQNKHHFCALGVTCQEAFW